MSSQPKPKSDIKEKTSKILVKPVPKESKAPKDEPKLAKEPKAPKVPKEPKAPKPQVVERVIVQQVARQKKAPSAYNIFLGKQMKEGKSFKEGIVAWNESKTKTN